MFIWALPYLGLISSLFIKVDEITSGNRPPELCGWRGGGMERSDSSGGEVGKWYGCKVGGLHTFPSHIYHGNVCSIAKWFHSGTRYLSTLELGEEKLDKKQMMETRKKPQRDVVSVINAFGVTNQRSDGTTWSCPTFSNRWKMPFNCFYCTIGATTNSSLKKTTAKKNNKLRNSQSPPIGRITNERGAERCADQAVCQCHPSAW